MTDQASTPVEDEPSDRETTLNVRRRDPRAAPIRSATFSQALGRFFQRYALFSGRSSRSEFWWIAGLSAILRGGDYAVTEGLENLNGGSAMVGREISPLTLALGIWNSFYIALIIAVIIPSIALIVRRMHDAGLSGWWAMLLLVPVLGWLTILCIALLSGTPAGEKYDRFAAPHVESPQSSPPPQR